LAVADRSTYYTRRGEVGYTDFPAYQIGKRGTPVGLAARAG
jgi:hypothetical protein